MQTTFFLSYHFSFILITLFLLPTHTMHLDTINTTQIFRDGDTLLSSGGIFELGFFSPGNSNNRYVGIWYKKIPSKTVVWVANRETPVLPNASAVLRLIQPGILVLVNETNDAILWNTSSSATVQNPIAQLLDSGNLVVRESANPLDFIWQSFDYPTDTLLPGMRLGWNLTARQEFYLSSWRSSDDPSRGDFTYRCDPSGYPQNVLKQGEILKYRTGPWNGVRWSGIPGLSDNLIFRYGLVLNKNAVYFHFELLNKSVVSRVTLSQSGFNQRLTWIDRTQDWNIYLTAPADNCDIYGLCGAYGSCNIANSPFCGCLNKFVPKDGDAQERGDWSKGCVRRTELSCEDGDVFLKYSGFKLPDTRRSWYNESMSLEECKGLCLNNCSCMAYSSLDISRGENGCLLWFDELLDIRELPERGQDIYIRMASSELESKAKRQKILIPVTLLLVLVIVLIGLSLILYYHRRKKIARGRMRIRGNNANNPNDQSHNKE